MTRSCAGPRLRSASNEPRQVLHEPELFEQLLRLEGEANDLYRPTNYWDSYAQHFLPELRRYGLHDFRRRTHSVLGSFGASDLTPVSSVDWTLPVLRSIDRLTRVRFVSRLAGALRRGIERLIARAAVLPASFESTMTYFHSQVAKKFERLGMSLDVLGTDRIGNPQGIVNINGSLWSWNHLNCASLLADALREIPLGELNTIVELGTGLGRNVQMLARLRPDATIFCFDIMPQVYVANQYLKTAMPDRVLPIEQGIDLTPSEEDIARARGKLVILPAWKMPEFRNLEIDLFWNTASFQEMEPHVVRNYLALVKDMKPRWISIHALPGGNYWGEWRPGRGGTKRPVTSSIYLDALAPEYICASDEPADYFLRALDYRAWVFGAGAARGTAPRS